MSNIALFRRLSEEEVVTSIIRELMSASDWQASWTRRLENVRSNSNWLDSDKRDMERCLERARERVVEYLRNGRIARCGWGGTAITWTGPSVRREGCYEADFYRPTEQASTSWNKQQESYEEEQASGSAEMGGDLIVDLIVDLQRACTEVGRRIEQDAQEHEQETKLRKKCAALEKQVEDLEALVELMQGKS